MSGACLVLVLGGCGRMAQSVYLSGCDRDIRNATQAIETCQGGVQCATAYSKRGSPYAEKARYSRTLKLIAEDEYERLFELAMKDHGQAVALDQRSAEVYLNRGQSYYNRATLEDRKSAKRWFDWAAADFETAIQKDARDYRAFDQLGLVHQQNGEPEKAIEDYTKEMALSPLGKARLVGSSYWCLASAGSDYCDSRFGTSPGEEVVINSTLSGLLTSPSSDVIGSVASTSAVPEPSTFALMLIVIGFALVMRKRIPPAFR